MNYLLFLKVVKCCVINFCMVKKVSFTPVVSPSNFDNFSSGTTILLLSGCFNLLSAIYFEITLMASVLEIRLPFGLSMKMHNSSETAEGDANPLGFRVFFRSPSH